MTLDEIDEAKIGDVLWDDKVVGLQLWVRSSGAKIFYLYYRTRTERRQRRPKIGVFGQITLNDARRRARVILDEVMLGGDPSGSWGDVRRESSLNDLFEVVLREHWSVERFVNSGWKKDVELYWKKHVESTLGLMRINSVRVRDVRAWHEGMRSDPVSANRSLSVLSKVFTWAEGNEYVLSNPCKHVKRYVERKRKRYASVEELRALFPILNSYLSTHVDGVVFLYLLLFTGSRPSAIERATWDDLDIICEDSKRYGVLSFHGKSTAATGSDESVIVPEFCLQLLELVPRRTTNRLVNTKMPHKLWRQVRAAAGCPDLWARDFRRTFATMGRSSGIEMDTISALLNHKSVETTKIYAFLDTKARVVAAHKIAEQIQTTMLPLGND